MQTTTKPGKQRKKLYNAPAHIRHKLMAAPLSNELASSKGAKTLPIRKGDTVRIMRGDNKGFEGKVSRVDLKTYRIYLEGLTREKVDGTNIFLAVHPSKVQIRNLTLDDKWRKNILERKTAPEKKDKKSKDKSAKKTEPKPAKTKAPITKEPELEEETFEDETTDEEETNLNETPTKAGKETQQEEETNPSQQEDDDVGDEE
jgi:large subunit ribosomal protein L24